MLLVPRPFPWLATLCALLGVAALCRLGYWQQERLVWKTNLQAQLDHEFALKELPDLSARDLDAIKDDDIRRGAVHGYLDFKKQVRLQGQIVDGKPVSYYLVPMILDESKTVFVVLGYTTGTDPLPEPTTRGSRDTVTGAARLPHWNRFTPPNQPGKDVWFRPDPGEMRAARGVPAPVASILYAEGSNYKLDARPMVPVEHTLRNDHKQYAIFWYTMAVVLAGMYFLRFWRPRKNQAS